MLFMKLMKDGGPVMWVILVLDIIALAVILQKTFQFHREEINIRELLRGLFNVLKRDGFVEAISLCDNTPGPVARMLSAAIAAKQQGNEDIRSAIDDAAFTEIPRLERGVRSACDGDYDRGEEHPRHGACREREREEAAE